MVAESDITLFFILHYLSGPFCILLVTDLTLFGLSGYDVKEGSEPASVESESSEEPEPDLEENVSPPDTEEWRP